MTSNKFYYQPIGIKQYPLIPVTLHHLSNAISISALIDSGADFGCFKAELADELGIPLERGEKREITTVGGKITAYMHNIEVQLFDKKIKCQVAFSREFRFHLNILGRQDFFNAHQILFKEKEKIVEITE